MRSAALPVHRHALPQLVVDGVLVALAYFLAFWLRFAGHPWGTHIRYRNAAGTVVKTGYDHRYRLLFSAPVPGYDANARRLVDAADRSMATFLAYRAAALECKRSASVGRADVEDTRAGEIAGHACCVQ